MANVGIIALGTAAVASVFLFSDCAQPAMTAVTPKPPLATQQENLRVQSGTRVTVFPAAANVGTMAAGIVITTAYGSKSFPATATVTRDAGIKTFTPQNIVVPVNPCGCGPSGPPVNGPVVSGSISNLTWSDDYGLSVFFTFPPDGYAFVTMMTPGGTTDSLGMTGPGNGTGSVVWDPSMFDGSQPSNATVTIYNGSGKQIGSGRLH